MGEALSEGGIFAHGKTRALLEVVRLAFEGGIGFDSEMLTSSRAATAEDGEGSVSAVACTARQKARAGRDQAQQQAHPPSRPASTGSSSRLVPGGPCMWCAVTATPQWRRPRGTNKLLCNACGIFFTRYGRLPEKSAQAHANTNQPVSPPSNTPAPPAAEAAVESPNGQAVSQPEHESADAKAEHASEQAARTQPQSSTSSLMGSSPHKRKAPPQPEAELLRCMEESAGSPVADSAASRLLPPAVGPVRQTIPMATAFPVQHPSQTGLVRSGPASADPECDAEALQVVPASHRAPAALAVAPMDVNLQHFVMRHPGLQGAAVMGLTTLPQLCLNAAPGTSPYGPAGACVLGHPVVTAPRHQWQQGALPMMPPELLGQPLTFQIGLLHSGVHLLDAAMAGGMQPPPRPLYARPPKRHERLPAGESEDSNASTDSHTAMQGYLGNSHEDDDGGTTTATTANTIIALGNLSGSPPGLATLHFPSTFFTCHPGRPLVSSGPGGGSAMEQIPLDAGLGLGASAAPAGLAPGANAPSIVMAVDEVEAHALPQAQQQEIILLHTRRSRGPRGRVSSAAVSSSTQSQ